VNAAILALALMAGLPEELAIVRPGLLPDPALDPVAADVLRHAGSAAKLPPPGPLAVPGYSRAVQCSTAAPGPRQAVQALRNGPRSRAFMTDPSLTVYGAATRRGPGGGILWCVVLGSGPGRTPPPGLDPVALDLIQGHNLERARLGVPPLRPSPALQRAALVQAQDMAQTGNLSHTGSDGSDVRVRVVREGYSWSRLGENAALGQVSAAQVMAEWIRSPGHAANIRNPAYTEIGAAGVGKSWIAVFGTPGGSRGPQGHRGAVSIPPVLTSPVRPSAQFR
jgi:uncharacterized protein YkwD